MSNLLSPHLSMKMGITLDNHIFNPIEKYKNSIIMAVGIDITERKIAENKIKTSLLR